MTAKTHNIHGGVLADIAGYIGGALIGWHYAGVLGAGVALTVLSIVAAIVLAD